MTTRRLSLSTTLLTHRGAPEPATMSSDDAQPARYRLSATLAGHAADVRALASTPRATHNGGATTRMLHSYNASVPVLFSASRDGSARSWLRRGGGGGEGDAASGPGWSEGQLFGGAETAAGHEGFVNAVEWTSQTGEDALGGASQLPPLVSTRASSGGSTQLAARCRPASRDLGS
mgnify:CR=1 FL=1